MRKLLFAAAGAAALTVATPAAAQWYGYGYSPYSYGYSPYSYSYPSYSYSYPYSYGYSYPYSYGYSYPSYGFRYSYSTRRYGRHVCRHHRGDYVWYTRC